MTRTEPEALIQLELNNPTFQADLLELQKTERHSALETLKKLRRMT